MSEVLKMSICGIRSYQNPDIQYISFVKPLTMILGQNGSGKTTIIECLKLMTCGELPATSQQGKNFVADPALTNSTETRGNVKLMFKAVNGRQILASRQLQVAIVKNKYCFKTIESCLKTRGPDGQELSINHTQVEMDRQVTELIGISKVVLDKVTFCHQEDSFWMFQDSSGISSVFEQLFDTKKFVSRGESFKQAYNATDKTLKENNKMFKVMFAKEPKDHYQELINMMAKADKIQHELNLVKYKLKEEGGNMVPQYRQENIRIKQKLNIAQHQLDQIDISQETKEAVLDLAQLQKNKAEQEETIEGLLEGKADNEQSLHITNQRVFELNEQMLKLSAGRSEYMDLEKQSQKLKRQLNSLLAKDEQDLPALLQLCTRQLAMWADRSNDKDISYYLTIVSNGEMAVLELDNQIQSISSQLATKRANLAQAEQQRIFLTDLQREYRETAEKVKKMEEVAERLQSQLKHTQLLMSKEQDKEEMAKQSIVRLNIQLDRVEVRQIHRAQREQNSLLQEQVTGMFAQINELTQQKETLLLKHPYSIDQDALQTRHDQLQPELESTLRQREKVAMQLEILKPQVLAKQEMLQHLAIMREVFEYEHIIKETQRQKKEGICAFCHQLVDLSTISKYISQQLDKEEYIQEKKEILKKSGFNPFQMQEQAQQVENLQYEHARLNYEYEDMREQMDNIEIQIQAKQDLKDIDEKVAQLQKEIQVKQGQMHKVEAEDYEDLDQGYLLRQRAEQQERQSMGYQAKQQHFEEIYGLEQVIRRQEKQYLEVKSAQEMKRRMINTYQQYIQSMEGVDKQVLRLDTALQEHKADRAKAAEALLRNKDSLREREVRLESERNMLQFQTNELKANLQQKRDLNEKDFQRQSKQQLKALSNSLSIAQKKKEQFEDEADEMQEQLEQQQKLNIETRKLIQEAQLQIKYRQQASLVDQLRKESRDIEQKLSDEEMRQRDLEAFRTEKEVLEERLNGLYGRMDQVQQDIREQEEEEKENGQLAQSLDIEQDKLMAEDLQTIYWQMDLVVLEMHRKKIKQINGLINDYWGRIYQGDDIQTIRIVTKQEEQTSTKKRLFKYYVMQVVHQNGRNVTQEMKGRCSMGQKVLASIVIRLALAEAFSGHNQIIALDEPTTNLDRHTIDSLSKQIASLIRIKKRVSNFQILIITHDLQFIQALKGALENIDENFHDSFYYEVCKQDTGSKIYQRNMRDL